MRSPLSLFLRSPLSPLLQSPLSPFLLFYLVVSFSSCQKVISIKLDSSAAQYVISGAISDQAGACQVSISRTKNFSGDNSFPGVSGAMVTVEYNGAVVPLPETSSGNYGAALQGQPGNTYLLRVNINGQVFTASSTMPRPVAPDSVYISTGRLSTTKYATVIYKDPPDTLNYYRFIQYVNGNKEKTIFVDNDEFTDGQKITSQLGYSNDTNDPARDIKTGDSVRIDILAIDAAVYKYWFSLNDGATGANQSASPANPVSNITGGALGCFSAHSVRGKTIRVP